MKYTYYWRDGKREVLEGRDPADALTQRGYGGGILRALDFYAEGDDADYRWEVASREWRRTVPLL